MDSQVIILNIIPRRSRAAGVNRQGKPRRGAAFGAKMADDYGREAGKFGLVRVGLGNISRYFALGDIIEQYGCPDFPTKLILGYYLVCNPLYSVVKFRLGVGLLKEGVKSSPEWRSRYVE